MSRQGTGKPEFRLRFDYPYIDVERTGERTGAPPQRIALEPGDPLPALRAVAAEVARSNGRLTAALPEAEVWRGRVAASEGAEVARRAAAAALCAAPREMCVALGPVGVDGLRPAAAARRDTLREARAFLARAGLKPHRMTGGGAFPGFDAPPAFPRISAPHALGLTGARAAAAAGGFAAALALMVWLAPWRDAAPAPETLAAAPVAIAPAAQALAPPITAPVATRVALVTPPRARPEVLPPPAPAFVLPNLVSVTLASRNAPVDIAPPAASGLENVRAPLPRPRAAVRPAAPARPADGSQGPLPRPAALGAAPAAAAAAGSLAPAATLDARAPGGPRPRPAGSQVEVLVASLGPNVLVSDQSPPAAQRRAAAEGSPRPRPAGIAAPVLVAALTPVTDVATDLGAAPAVAPPLRRIVPAAAKPAAAKPVAAPAPARSKPVAAAAPVADRAQPVRAAAQPKPAAKVRIVHVRPAQAPVRTAAVAPRPVRALPKAQPARVQQTRAQRAPAPTRQSGLSGDSLALVGIFGGANGRHALVQLPNGATERVRAGDQIQGVQVTAIAADGVRLRARGRETVLRLPD